MLFTAMLQYQGHESISEAETGKGRRSCESDAGKNEVEPQTLRRMSPYVAPGLNHDPLDFIQSVCSETNIPLSQIRGKSRLREVVEVRQFIAYVLQAEFLMSQPATGIMINRDHATARYSRVTFQANYQTDKNFRIKYDELCKKTGISIALKTVRD